MGLSRSAEHPSIRRIPGVGKPHRREMQRPTPIRKVKSAKIGKLTMKTSGRKGR